MKPPTIRETYRFHTSLQYFTLIMQTKKNLMIIKTNNDEQYL